MTTDITSSNRRFVCSATASLVGIAISTHAVALSEQNVVTPIFDDVEPSTSVDGFWSGEDSDTIVELPELSSEYFEQEQKEREKTEEALLNTVASQASSLAQQDSADARVDSLTNTSINYFSNQILSTTESWFNRLGTSQFSLDISSRGIYGDFDVLVPLNYESNVERYFIQVGAVLNDDNSYNGRDFVNLGFGYRSIVPESSIGSYLWGINNFYDFDVSRGNARSSLGLEFSYNALKASANYYFPLTDWQESQDSFSSLTGIDLLERPAEGFDINLDGYVPAYPQVGYGISLAQYFGDLVEMSNGNDPEADPLILSANVNYTPFPLMSMRAGITSEAGDVEGNAGVQVNYNFGQSLNSQLEPSNVALSRELSQQLDQIVNRDKNVRLEYKAVNNVAIDIPAEYHATEGQALTVTPNISSVYGVKRVSFSGSFSDHLIETIPQQGARFMSPIANYDASKNVYPLKVTVEDTRGNIETADTAVIVGIDPSLAIEILIDDTTITYGESGTLNWSYLNPRSLSDEAETSAPYSFSYGGTALDALDDPTSFTPNWDSMNLPVSADPNGGSHTFSISLEDELGFSAEKSVIIFVANREVTLSNLTEITSPASVVANGTDEIVLNIDVNDTKTGDPAEDIRIYASVDGGARLDVGVTDANGIAEIKVTSTVTGPQTLVVEVPSDPNKSEIEIEFVGDEASAVIKDNSATANAKSVAANGSDTIEISALVVDSFGNPLQGIEAELADYGDNATVIGGNKSLSGTDGRVSFQLSSIIAESLTPSFVVGGSKDSVQFDFVADSSTATVDIIEASIDGIVANGSAKAEVQVFVVDRNDNPVTGHRILWESALGASLDFASSITDENGIANTTLTSETVGQFNIYAYPQGLSGEQNAVLVEFVANNGQGNQFEPGSMKVEVDKNVAGEGNANIPMVRVVDEEGNPIVDAEVEWSSTSTKVTFETRTSKSDSEGWARALVHSNEAGEYEVVAKFESVQDSTVTEFIPSSADAVLSFESTPSGKIVADDRATATFDVKLVNGEGEPLSELSVDWTIPSGMTVINNAVNSSGVSSSSTQVTTYTNAMGLAQISVKSNQPAVGEVVARFEDASVSYPVEFVADTNTARFSQLQTVLTGNVFENRPSELKVGVSNASGLPLIGYNINLNTPYTVQNPSAVTDDSGVVTFELMHTIAGAYPVEVSIAELPSAGSEVVTVEILGATGRPVEVADINEITSPGSVRANGSDEIIVELVIEDSSSGELVENVRVFASTDSASTINTTDSDVNGIATVTIASYNAGKSNLLLQIEGGKTQDTFEIEFIGDDNTAQIETGSFLTSSNQIAANDNEQVLLSATVVDDSGNPLEGVTAQLDNIGNASIVGGNNTTSSDATGRVTFTLHSQVAEALQPQLTVSTSTEVIDLTFVADDTTARIESVVEVEDGVFANGSAKALVSVRVEDQFGNLVPQHTVNWDPGNELSLGASVSLTDDAGVAFTSMTSNVVKTHVLYVTTMNSSADAERVLVDFVSGNTDGDQIEAGSMKLSVDGNVAGTGNQNVAMIRVVDENGEGLQGEDIIWSSDETASITFEQLITSTDSDGWATAKLSSVQHGEFEVRAEFDSTGDIETQTTTFIESSANASITWQKELSRPLIGDGKDTGIVQVKLLDSLGEPLVDHTVRWAAPSGVTFTNVAEFGAQASGASVQTTTKTNNSGIAEVLFVSNMPISGHVEAFYEDSHLTTPFEFEIDSSTGIFDPVSVSSGVLLTNKPAEVSLTLANELGFPLIGKTVEFSDLTVLNPGAVTDENGQVSYEISSTSAGLFSSVMTVSGEPLIGGKEIDVLIAGPVDIDVAFDKSTVKADGIDSLEVTITFQNVVNDFVLTLDNPEEVDSHRVVSGPTTVTVTPDNNTVSYVVKAYAVGSTSLKFKGDDGFIPGGGFDVELVADGFDISNYLNPSSDITGVDFTYETMTGLYYASNFPDTINISGFSFETFDGNRINDVDVNAELADVSNVAVLGGKGSFALSDRSDLTWSLKVPSIFEKVFDEPSHEVSINSVLVPTTVTGKVPYNGYTTNVHTVKVSKSTSNSTASLFLEGLPNGGGTNTCTLGDQINMAPLADKFNIHVVRTNTGGIQLNTATGRIIAASNSTSPASGAWLPNISRNISSGNGTILNGKTSVRVSQGMGYYVVDIDNSNSVSSNANSHGFGFCKA